MKILMPCHPYENLKIDPNFTEEFAAAKLGGFHIKLYDHDTFITDIKVIIKHPEYEPPYPISEKVEIAILRGWMLSVEQYQLFQDFLASKYKLINSPEEYKLCHYAPENYEYIKECTPKMDWFVNIDEAYEKLKQFEEKVILKDYVKSEKGTEFHTISTDTSEEDLKKKLDGFRKKRHTLFNKGFVFKQFVNLKKYGDKTNEWRIFFLDKQLISVSQNSNLKIADKPKISWLFPVMARIPSRFFTIDIAEKEDGTWTILEIGDGQVSGPSPGQNLLEFYAKIKEVINL